MPIAEVPGVLTLEWIDKVKATIDIWKSYAITAEQFRDAIIVKGVANAKAHGSHAWINDSSQAKGAFSPEVQKVIEEESFKTFAKIGIKYFLVIKSASAITNMSINRYNAKTGPCGLQMVEVPDLKSAIEWLEQHPN